MVTSLLVYFVTFEYRNNVPWNLICRNPLKIGFYLYFSRKGLYFFLPVKRLFQPQTTCTSTCHGLLSTQVKAGKFPYCPFLCSIFISCSLLRYRSFMCSFLLASSPHMSSRLSHLFPICHKVIKIEV